MKKLISILLAAAMVVTLSATALAVEAPEKAPGSEEAVFVLGHILGNDKDLSVFDAIEILKYLAGLPSLLTHPNSEIQNRALHASLITAQSKIDGEPHIRDAIEILKEVAGMHSGLSFIFMD